MDVMRTLRLSIGRLITPTPEGPVESFCYAMDCFGALRRPPRCRALSELDYTLTQPVNLQGCSSRGPTRGYSSFAPAATGSNPTGHLVCWSYRAPSRIVKLRSQPVRSAPRRIVRGKAVCSSLASERFACSRKVLMMSAPVRSAPLKLQPVKFVLRIRASRWTLPAKTAPAAWTKTSLARMNPAPLNCELSDAAVKSASMKSASVNVDSARLATLRFARLNRAPTATECPMNVPSDSHR
jgi:hypothetical protein